jgi:protein-L-isoaspartate O-methyltransferase
VVKKDPIHDKARIQLAEKVAASGVRHRQVLEAIATVPRHAFVDEALDTRAYEDSALPIGHQQTISKPSVVARMVELLFKTKKDLGKVLEIGTGSGYGLKLIADKADQFVTIDKHKTDFSLPDHEANKIQFVQMNIPPLTGIPDNEFDFVITFQVIEHINKDKAFVDEIRRVLKRGGKLIVTTPNSKMSLTRNPWHVREYTVNQLENLLRNKFESVKTLGLMHLSVSIN